MRVLSIVVAASIVACVPPSEKRAPAGAAGLAVEPSPAARGEPFLTNDGWTIHFDLVLCQASVSAEGLTGRLASYSRSEQYRWNGSKRAEIFARALPVGAARVSASPFSFYTVPDAFDRTYEDGDYFEDLGLSAEDSARFRLPADASSVEPFTSGGTPYRPGPSLVIRLRAQRDGRNVGLDLGFHTIASGNLAQRVVEVREDALSLAPITLAPEHIVAADFTTIADADTDADGLVTADELRAVPAECEGCTSPPPSDVPRFNLLARLLARSNEILR